MFRHLHLPSNESSGRKDATGPSRPSLQPRPSLPPPAQSRPSFTPRPYQPPTYQSPSPSSLHPPPHSSRAPSFDKENATPTTYRSPSPSSLHSPPLSRRAPHPRQPNRNGTHRGPKSREHLHIIVAVGQDKDLPPGVLVSEVSDLPELLDGEASSGDHDPHPRLALLRLLVNAHEIPPLEVPLREGLLVLHGDAPVVGLDLLGHGLLKPLDAVLLHDPHDPCAPTRRGRGEGWPRTA